ncbi:glycoside hydrolase [bacterium]|nr:glycoside hydrolase [bacterium]MDB4423289.1 glycoside hydrolase [Rhodopirellula sp.]
MMIGTSLAARKLPAEPPEKPHRRNVPTRKSLIKSITKQTLWKNRDGKGTTWFHPRACMLPLDPKSKDNQTTALMLLQEIGGSDYFGPVHASESADMGKSWSLPQPVASLGRDPVAGDKGLHAGVCDVTPQYHPPTDTTLALGHVVFYRGPKFATKDQLARFPVYAVRRRDGSWSERKRLNWNDPRGAFIYSNNCGQRVVMPNGDIMMSFTFGPESQHRMVAGVRCTFDGETLRVAEVGKPLINLVGRGLLEPSVTQFDNQFLMTIRAEDGHGYVAVSEDGIDYEKQQAWRWDDGKEIGMSTTQQHWLTRGDALFLVYTRQDTINQNVIRWRSPLWVARVDPGRRVLIRETEQTVLPMIGDGIAEPEGVALMGNFNITNASPMESWVTVGEWMPKRNAVGDVLLARIGWTKPNELISH